jgi:hypothetical protein
MLQEVKLESIKIMEGVQLFVFVYVFISNSIESLYRSENKSQTTEYRKCHNYSI